MKPSKLLILGLCLFDRCIWAAQGLKCAAFLAFYLRGGFFVLVPALLTGREAYLWIALVCFYIIGMSLLLINGLNEKTLAAGAASVLGMSVAVMDVSMDIASALKELSQTSEGQAFPQLIKSGFAIGKDSIGTMANTLILAYVGGSLGSLLLVALNMNNLTYLMNSEGMVAELLQMLIGAFSMLFTIPFAAVICGLLYTREKRTATVTEN